ncbi:MAG: tRNA epoxyqueuosine(34) reductase QueG [Myxococcales bacterium]|nr:tRNA epoxyqueuosine(34) reductase QueG [Myxococcales bacterium]
MDLLAATPAERRDWIRESGRRHGFDDVDIAPPFADGGAPHADMARFDEWLERGYHGTMTYMQRHRRRRTDPDRTLKGVRGIIVVALDYDTRAPRKAEVAPDEERGWVSRYAWGTDYHGLIEARLDDWVDELEAAAPGHRFMRYVDHGPVLEKLYGRLAGLGWQGRHTNLIHPKRGSYFFLASMLTTLEVATGAPLPDLCGSCTACVDACPTGAIVDHYVVDARRCISYLTIETKAPVPDALAPALGDHLFGCDICQDVCPWNRKPIPPHRPEFQPRESSYRPRLDALITMDDAEFEAAFHGTPLHRAGRERLASRATAIRETALPAVTPSHRPPPAEESP